MVRGDEVLGVMHATKATDGVAMISLDEAIDKPSSCTRHSKTQESRAKGWSHLGLEHAARPVGMVILVRFMGGWEVR